MIVNILLFGSGFILGALMGVFVTALIAAARDED